MFRGTSTSDVTGCTFSHDFAAVSGQAVYDSHVAVSGPAPRLLHRLQAACVLGAENCSGLGWPCAHP